MKTEPMFSRSLLFSRLRTVYFRPSNAADEAMAIGVIVQEANGQLKLVTIESPHALEAFRFLFGESGLEQIIFVTRLLKDFIKYEKEDVEALESPISNLFFGNTQACANEDPIRYAREYLALASSLVRERKYRPEKRTISQDDVSRVLYDEVSQINVIVATRLFEGYRLSVPRGKPIKLPIYGERIMGAPISMVTKQIGAAKNLAEAYCAKLTYARKSVGRIPALYVLIPPISKSTNQDFLDDSLGELSVIADSNDIIVRVEKSAAELAQALIYDEKQ